MLTYQDFLATQNKLDFVYNAVQEYRGSPLYSMAYTADQYNRHRNVTIVEYQKLLYTVTGKAVPDNYSANFKMACRHFHRFVVQEVQYLLGNGVEWGKRKATSDRLGKLFDNQLQELAKKALVCGVAYGFFNIDHMDVFSALDFVPLYHEEDGSMYAGIRFWQISADKPLRATLYELDGYTEYIWTNGKGRELQAKRAYKLKYRQSGVDGLEIYDGENYPAFPIVPLWANDEHQSELVGLREQIDCYDLIKSGFANTVDEASYVYWTIQNAGGMDDTDLVKFVERMKTVHAAAVGEDGMGATAESHEQDVPYASREALLDRLDRDMYRDAMALNANDIAGGAVTATQIEAAYEPLNNKADDFEYQVRSFLNGILVVAGIDDEPSFTRSAVVNRSEEIDNIIKIAQYMPDDYIVQKLLAVMGDVDKTEDILKQIAADELDRFNGREEDENEDQQDEDLRAGGQRESGETADER